MGLLDSVLGAVTGGGQSQGGGQAALVNAVIQMIGNSSGGAGGLGGLVGALSHGGLGNLASSWVGSGQNLPISPEQIQSALGGSGILAQLAQSAGMSPGDTSSQLSQLLPGLVDKLTPDGQIPQADSLEKMLGAFNIGT